MVAGVPFQVGGDALTGEEGVLLADGIAHLSHDGVSGFLLLVAQTEIDGWGMGCVVGCILSPARIPDGGGCSGYAFKLGGLVGCPEGKESSQGIASKQAMGDRAHDGWQGWEELMEDVVQGVCCSVAEGLLAKHGG